MRITCEIEWFDNDDLYDVQEKDIERALNIYLAKKQRIYQVTIIDEDREPYIEDLCDILEEERKNAR